ncbi:hypothetical protein D3C81_1705100 [compost metagenome]
MGAEQAGFCLCQRLGDSNPADRCVRRYPRRDTRSVYVQTVLPHRAAVLLRLLCRKTVCADYDGCNLTDPRSCTDDHLAANPTRLELCVAKYDQHESDAFGLHFRGH